MGAKTQELRAAISLYKAEWESVRSHLETIYDWFTEGHGTVDLLAARVLIRTHVAVICCIQLLPVNHFSVAYQVI